MNEQQSGMQETDPIDKFANYPEDPEDETADTSALHMGNTTLQSKAEFNLDKNSSHIKEDDSMSVTGTDDLATDSDGKAGLARAETAEKSSYGDIELNKGLESQAKDAEG